MRQLQMLSLTATWRKRRSHNCENCNKFGDVLTGKPGKTTLIEHTITTNTDSPIMCKLYRIPYNCRDEFKEAIDNIATEGIIYKSFYKSL